MSAQRDNRHETIINQDASVLMDAVRNGERGLDDLTNYVIGITNYSLNFQCARHSRQGFCHGLFDPGCKPRWPAIATPDSHQRLLDHRRAQHTKNRPHSSGVGFTSNHVVAVFRSLSGPANEKPPQLNPTIQEMALTYKVIADVSDYSTNFYDTTWTNFTLANLSTNDIATRSNYMRLVRNMYTNLHDVRLTFLWPVLPSGKLGPGRQVYRTMVSGRYTNDPPTSPYFFFQPRTYF
jgi:hypothetical protein